MAEATASSTPEAAQAQITALKQDRGFVSRFSSADATVNGPARAEMASLTKIAHPDESPTATTSAPAATTPAPAVDKAAHQAARTELAAKKADPSAVKKYLAGDAAERAAWAKLHEQAYPGDIGDGKGVDAGKVQARTDADGVPTKPEHYRFEYAPTVNIDKALDTEFRQIAHGAGLPESIARYAFNAWNKTGGKGLTDAELRLKTQGTAEKLQQRWGDQYQAKLDAAKSIFKSLPDAQRARIGQLFDHSGLGSDELLIVQLESLAARRAQSKSG